MSDSLVIASYNVLADAYARPEWSPRTPPRLLAWDSRKEALAARMLTLNADVLCLQEVEADAFAFWAERLRAHGYDGVYAQKGAAKPDGCATFFRLAALTFVRDRAFLYGDNSGHLAHLTTFDWGQIPLRVANTHLQWSPSGTPTEQHAGFRQMQALMETHLLPLAPEDVWVVCGDFNALPESPVLGLLSAQGLVDASQAAPQPTCVSNGCAKRIDFIFHTPNLASEPGHLPVIDDQTPLPSETEPSDHLPLTARLGAPGV